MNNEIDLEELQQQQAEQVQKSVEEMDHEAVLAKMHNFYTLKRDKRTGEPAIQFNILLLLNKLRELGFLRYDLPNGSHELIQVKDNKIEVVSEKKIIDAFDEYLWSLPTFHKVTNAGTDIIEMNVTSYMLRDKISQNITYYFGKNLERLRPIDKNGRTTEIKIMQDSKDVKYLYYRNCAIKITKDGIEHIYYSDLDFGCIMANSIIDRDFPIFPNLIDNSKRGDFETFCHIISGGDAKRLQSLQTILGYLMHDFYDTDLRAIYFTDVNMENSTRAAGGTGKGILGMALANVLNRNPREDVRYIAIPGKGFCATEPKRYAAGDMTTQLIHIQDLDKRFNFSDLYNDITDGAIFQKHYQNPTYRRVKIMLSMNQALDLNGSSDKRRVCIFELANYFSDKLRPEQVFGHRFFDNHWDREQWQKFDLFMANCAMLYLRNGIIDTDIININTRAVIEKIGADLYYWLQDPTRFGGVPEERKQIAKSTMWQDFDKKYPGQFMSQKTFTGACQNYLTLKGIRSAVWRDGIDWFILYPNDNDYRKTTLQIIV